MPPSPLRAAVAGATGYIGMQCAELLAAHPGVDTLTLLARSTAGQTFAEAVPGSRLALSVEAGLDPGDVDVIFSCLPHTVAAVHAADWIARGIVVVDLSADFRLRDVSRFERWYDVVHPAPDLVASAVYALPELMTHEVGEANLFAVPGCYPTASLLAVAPALRAGLIEADIVIDAKSGVSGTGRSPALSGHFSEVNESVSAYGVVGHRHSAEMEQELARLSESPVRFTFVPHVVPMTRGLLVTAYLRPRAGVKGTDVVNLYREFCAGHPCLRYDERPPATKGVAHTGLAAIHAAEQGETVVVVCAIDNLLKGAASQAVQAMNLRFGIAEHVGIPLTAPWP